MKTKSAQLTYFLNENSHFQKHWYNLRKYLELNQGILGRHWNVVNISFLTASFLKSPPTGERKARQTYQKMPFHLLVLLKIFWMSVTWAVVLILCHLFLHRQKYRHQPQFQRSTGLLLSHALCRQSLTIKDDNFSYHKHYYIVTIISSWL